MNMDLDVRGLPLPEKGLKVFDKCCEMLRAKFATILGMN